MKNLIKTTSLVSACLLSACALAQAEDSDTISTATIGQTVSTSNSTFSWSKLESSLSNWALSFTLNGTSTTSGTAVFISTSRTNQNGASGLSVLVYAENSTTETTRYLVLGNGNSAFTVTDDDGTTSYYSLAWDSSHTYTLAYASDVLYLADTSTGNYVSYDTSATSYTSTLTSATSSQWSNSGNESSTVIGVADISSIKDESNSVISYITTMSLVPEPSAFGLLAGLGALAFVAARRRRRSRKVA